MSANEQVSDDGYFEPGEFFESAGRGVIDELERLAEKEEAVGYFGLALGLSSLNGHVDCVRLLVEKGADANVLNEDAEGSGWTALMAAAESGNLDCVRLLIERGAEVNTRNKDGWTALMKAARWDHVECARLLIENGADVNATANDGSTPLMQASSNSQIDCARLLLQNGANACASNTEGQTALTMASHTGIMALLVPFSRNKPVTTRNFDDLKLMLYCGAKIAVETTSPDTGGPKLPEDCWPILSLQAACRAVIWQQMARACRHLSDISAAISRLSVVLPENIISYLKEIDNYNDHDDDGD